MPKPHKAPAPEHTGPRWYRWRWQHARCVLTPWAYHYGTPDVLLRQSEDGPCAAAMLVTEPIDQPPIKWLRAEYNRLHEERNQRDAYQDVVRRAMWEHGV